MKGITQQGLGMLMEKSQNWVQKLEKGEIDVNLSTIKNLAEQLEVEPNQLLFNYPQQIFNNCTQSGSGTFHNCVVNSEEIIEKLIRVLTKIDSKL